MVLRFNFVFSDSDMMDYRAELLQVASKRVMAAKRCGLGAGVAPLPPACRYCRRYCRRRLSARSERPELDGAKGRRIVVRRTEPRRRENVVNAISSCYLNRICSRIVVGGTTVRRYDGTTVHCGSRQLKQRNTPDNKRVGLIQKNISSQS